MTAAKKAESTPDEKPEAKKDEQAASTAIAEPANPVSNVQTIKDKDGAERIISTIPNDGWEANDGKPDKDEVARIKKFNADQKKAADERAGKSS